MVRVWVLGKTVIPLLHTGPVYVLLLQCCMTSYCVVEQFVLTKIKEDYYYVQRKCSGNVLEGIS